jgi:hypothetical protein
VCANNQSDSVVHWLGYREPDPDTQRNAEHEPYPYLNRDAESEPNAESLSHADAECVAVGVRFNYRNWYSVAERHWITKYDSDANSQPNAVQQSNIER